MCDSSPKVEPAPPPVQAPMVLEQVAPKTASSESEAKKKKKRQGLSRYKINKADTAASTGNGRSVSLGGISKKTGV